MHQLPAADSFEWGRVQKLRYLDFWLRTINVFRRPVFSRAHNQLDPLKVLGV